MNLHYVTDIPQFKDKNVLVMGLGLFSGGVQMTKYLLAKGARVTVTDLKDEKKLAQSLKDLQGLPVKFALGRHNDEDFTSADIILVNPAIPKDSPCLKIASHAGVPIETEMNLFFKLCKAPIVAVTGSNGKSTTTALIADILKYTGRTVYLGGNIGRSLINDVDKITPDDIAVVEISSFQLEDLGYINKSPYVAVVTNLSPNHLDRHKSAEAYYAAKKNIILHQSPDDWCVLNGDDVILKDWAKDSPSKTLTFSRFNTGGDGAYVADNIVRTVLDGVRQDVLATHEIPLPGMHNVENVLAACCAGRIFDVAPEKMRQAIMNFHALEHRLEFVRELDGIRFYNDSIATTPESTICALDSFDAPITVIVGGYDKGISFDALGKKLVEKTANVVLIGQTADKIADAIAKYRINPLYPHLCFPRTFQDAVSRALNRSQAGYIVILSPACASYDMFQNFEDRGNQFKNLVHQL